MPVYNLVEYSYNYSKASGSLWQYYRDKPAFNNAGNVVDFTNDDNNNNSNPFELKQKITGQTSNDGT